MYPSPMPFELWRQDDNGQRFLVGCYRNFDEAESRLAELTRVQHKQTYWISETEVREDRR
ncbi:MAG: hypothetical protein NDI73_08445 [Desulfuromonadales bacterium]|nr:hypothetical protein [Desulfuromonadales bacterium]